MKKTAFVYTDEYSQYDYGPTHPLRTSRLKVAYDLIDACGLLSLPQVLSVKPGKAGFEDLLRFHSREYLEVLQAVNSGIDLPYSSFYGLGPGDNPVFRGLFDWSSLVAGASLKAASLVERGDADIAFNIAGGLHHAMSSKASGFCYINDIVVAIAFLLQKGKRVAYLDIDAHHGDGVQAAFYRTDKVLTISIHETGKVLFPGTGFEYETGEGEGEGYSVNIPMPPYSDDELFLYAFDEIVPPLIRRFGPDIMVSQLGVDSFMHDPLAHLNYTNNGFCESVRRIKKIAPKWVALGGGGYDVMNVAKAWTLAWAIMNDAAIPEMMPEEFVAGHGSEGILRRHMRDEPYLEKGIAKEQMREEVERTVQFVKQKALQG